MTAKLDIATAGKVFQLKIKAKMWPYIPIMPENGGKIWSCSCKINKHETCTQCFKSHKYMGDLSYQYPYDGGMTIIRYIYTHTGYHTIFYSKYASEWVDPPLII